jgi:NADPH:quinone reductase-like Zn-dependent oxidoreductase
MRAVVITRHGGPEVLEVREVSEPQPKPGEVLVRVDAGGVNFADLLAAKGGYPGTPPPPLVAGREFCGKRLDTGERVMGYTQSQAFAELVAIRPGFMWAAPERWSAEECAAFPVNFFTAYLAYWKAGLTGTDEPLMNADQRGSDAGKNQRSSAFISGPRSSTRQPRVLIHAVAGGVGTAAVQIGTILGCETFGTSSSDEKLHEVKKLGLTHAINYTRDDYVETVRVLTANEGVDAVFEMLGGEHVKKSVLCLAWLGRVVTYGSATGERPHFDPHILYERQTSVHGLWLSKISLHPEIMRPAWRELSHWIAEDRLRPQVGHVLPMERAADAYRLLSDRGNYGKVVLQIGS